MSQPLCSRPAAVNSSCLLLFLALAPWACVSQNETGSSRCCPGWSLCRAMQGWRQGQQPVPQWVSAPPTPSMVWEWRQAAGSHPGFSLWTLICKHTPSCRNIIARPKNRSPWAAWPRSGVFVGSVVLFLFLFSLHFFFFSLWKQVLRDLLIFPRMPFLFLHAPPFRVKFHFPKK